MMLPSFSIRSYKTFVQTKCLPLIRKAQTRQFLFGLDSLALRPFVSLGSNARSTMLSRSAAESKMLRLLGNERLRNQLATLSLRLNKVTSTTLVNVDHTEVNGLSVLMFAQQTKAGRALPLYLETMPSLVQGHQKASPQYQLAKERYQQWKADTGLDQYGYTIPCMELLRRRLGFLPKLVFDRGFCNKRILKYLKRVGATGYVRAREDFRVRTLSGAKQRIGDFKPGSHIVRFGCLLRLVVGEKRSASTPRIYVLTTDFTSSNDFILKAYYHRFEIEELFRDMKSILMTKRSRIKKPEHLATVFWFVCLGIVILHALRPEQPTKAVHPKKKLSIFRELMESYERVIHSERSLTTGYG